MSASPFYLQLLLLVKKFASFTLIKVDSLPFHVTGSTIPAHEPDFKTCLCLPGMIMGALKSGAKGLPFLKIMENGDIEGISALVSSMDPATREDLLRRCSAGPNEETLVKR
ncbi:hypothetical protein P8452_48025 [Trifolium repens]|nr:hypothetical protein P8452_48025 [Trifolium repens]